MTSIKPSLSIYKLALCLIMAFLFFWQGSLSGQDETDTQTSVSGTDEGWQTLKSAYCTVYYKPDTNLKRLLGKLSGREIPADRNPPSYSFGGPEAKLAYRLDMILMRVKNILGIYPAQVNIKIKIYKTRRDFASEYCQLTKSSDDCRSFYVFSYNTIYTSEQDVTDSIMAHEMAHALVDNYFSTVPPEEVGEILARNVDQHLDDY